MKPIILDPNFATTRMVITGDRSTEDLSQQQNNQSTWPQSSLQSTVDQGQNIGGLRTKGYQKRSFGLKERSQLDLIEDQSEFLPLVTIITVVYNNDLYLEETINSVINQSYSNLEYIIIDGGSTDKTLDIIRRYQDCIDYWISESDRGLYDAMNKGIALATGEIIGILNSDDLYFETTTVDNIVREYQKVQQPCVIYGSMYKFADEYHTVSLHRGDLSDRAFQTANILINHPTCFVHRLLYQEFGGFKPEYEVGADRELMMRFHSQNTTFINLERAIAKFRLGGTTSNQSLLSIVNREIIQEYKLLSCYGINKTRIVTVLLRKTVQSFRKWLIYQLLGEKLTNRIIMLYVSRKFPLY
ncbi:MAG: glycosyltransferase family 2 protein [Waterburya sp.]